MKKLTHLFNYLGIKQRILLTYILLITIPIGVLGLNYFITTKNFVSDIVKNNLHEILVKNNESIDSKLERIKEYSLNFVIDANLEDLLSKTYNSADTYEVYELDHKINNILNKYFFASPDIYSVSLATSDYVFGNSSAAKDYIPKDTFNKTELYDSALAAEGKLTWVPTYNFVELFNQPEMEHVSFDYKYMFSAVKLVNSNTIKFRGTNGGRIAEHPVLLININDKFFDKIFKNNIPINHMDYFIVTKEGRIVTHPDKTKLGKYEQYPWLASIYEKKSGINVVEIDGKKMIVIYDTSKITDWVSIITMQENFLIQDVMPAIKYNLFSALAIVMIIPLLISYLLSGMIARPINSLTSAIRKMGRGNFDIKIPAEGSYEFKKLIHKFNSMNRRIQALIKENYKNTILKKEAEIKALNLQLNPHFMYNTLNIINLKLIRNGQDETSELIMSLSTMLKYSLKANDGVVLFYQDMEYTKCYIHIMSKRFENQFELKYSIDPRLYEYTVPKFFLQPLVENALIHGFQEMDQKGCLTITCWIEGDKRYYSVDDNGVGMTKEKIWKLLNTSQTSIGISNVRNRILIIYGEEYDINIQSEPSQGTKITIGLPL
ncbi:cache domain-containing sensor histidine kinase [Paenibacillus agricola]|uniref:Histidine kinase n=1 Tax=Paenibacillus agricola TaxID=2716264 RepID=A0ABX0J9V3_9BACL|nr:sensor histidine kinase [Paenibacillus agricola]NHN32170.1 histidine kinase [Paenibacillus agricola]